MSPIREDSELLAADVDQAMATTEDALRRQRVEQAAFLEAGQWSLARSCEALIGTAEHWLQTLAQFREARFGKPAAPAPAADRLETCRTIEAALRAEYERTLHRALDRTNVFPDAAVREAQQAWHTWRAFRADVGTVMNASSLGVLLPPAPNEHPELVGFVTGAPPLPVDRSRWERLTAAGGVTNAS